MANGRYARLRHIAFLLLRISGLPFLVRELFQRRKVTILVYHKLAPAVADSHLAALRRKYNFISLSEYLKYRTDPTKTLPVKSLILTLDDGHKINYELKPIFEKHGVRATIFLCSGVVGTNRHFWFESDMDNDMRQRLKYVHNDERLKILANIGFSESAEWPTRQALSAGEIEEMKEVVDFQSHTVHHPVLPQCSGARSLEEIAVSKAQLEAKFGLSVNALAYPNGDYSIREVEMADKAGYECALSLDSGFNSRVTPAFQLRRICIEDDADINELLVKASGLWGFLKRDRSPYTTRSLGAYTQAEQAA